MRALGPESFRDLLTQTPSKNVVSISFVDQFLSGALCGEDFSWPVSENHVFEDLFIERSFFHDVQPLLHQRLSATPAWLSWPLRVRQTLEEQVHFEGIQKMLRKTELETILTALNEMRIPVFLMKGMPLAYFLYPYPYLRPSLDIDLMISKKNLKTVEDLMRSMGYRMPNAIQGEFISHQNTFIKKDSEGIVHAYDFHWKISNPAVFSDALSFEEISEYSIPVAKLGPYARTLCLEQALFLACIHRVAHHAGKERLIWIYDIHLLLQKMDLSLLKSFTEWAEKRKLSAICRDGLERSQKIFGSSIPPEVIQVLSPENSKKERSASYLRSHGGINLFMSNLRALPSLGARATYIKESFFPSPEYLSKKYGVSNPYLAPLLYLRRLMEGLVKIILNIKK